MQLWCASLDIASTVLSPADLAQAFGRVGALYGQVGGRSRAGKTFSENTWRLATAPSPAPADAHLQVLFDAAAGPLEVLRGSEIDGAVLGVTHYGVEPDELTSRLFVAPEWLELLAAFGGWVEVEHRITQPEGLPKFVMHPIGLLEGSPS